MFHVKNCILILLLLKVDALDSLPIFGLLGNLLGGGAPFAPQPSLYAQPPNPYQQPQSFAQLPPNPNQQPPNPYQQPPNPYQQPYYPWSPQHPTIFSPYSGIGGAIPTLSAGIFNAINGQAYSVQSMVGGLFGAIASIFGNAFPPFPPQPYPP